MKLTKTKKSRMKCSSHELEKYTICFLVEVFQHLKDVASPISFITYLIKIFIPISLSMSHLSSDQQAANYTNPVSRHPHTLPAYTCAQYCLLQGNRLVVKIFLIAWSYGHCWKLSENENVIRLY